MAEEVSSTAPEAGPGESTETPPAAAPRAKGSGGSGTTGESALLEKIDRLHGELSDERRKHKITASERDQFKTSATTLEVKDKKRTALDAALDTVGEDFEINAERKKALIENVEALSYSDGLNDRVLSLVNLAKQPKAASNLETPFSRPAANGSGSTDTHEVPEKKPEDYTTHELMALSRTDPERYKAVREARDKIIGFGRK